MISGVNWWCSGQCIYVKTHTHTRVLQYGEMLSSWVALYLLLQQCSGLMTKQSGLVYVNAMRQSIHQSILCTALQKAEYLAMLW